MSCSSWPVSIGLLWLPVPLLLNGRKSSFSNGRSSNVIGNEETQHRIAENTTIIIVVELNMSGSYVKYVLLMNRLQVHEILHNDNIMFSVVTVSISCG